MESYPTVVDDLRTLPPRFHLDLEPPPDSSTLADLMSRPELFAEWINIDAARVGAPEGQVAASMFVQRTAMILGGAAMAAGFVSGALPIAKSDEVHIALGESSPMSGWRFALGNPRFETGDRKHLIRTWTDHWIDGILMELVDAIRSRTRVGHQMLRDNVASAAGSTLVFFSHWAPDEGYHRRLIACQNACPVYQEIARLNPPWMRGTLAAG